MIDFVKINYTDKNYQLPTTKTDFIISVNNETGETDGKKSGNFHGMEIIKFQSERTLIKGSIHKFYNRTDFNGNDFDLANLYTAIEDLNNEIHLHPDFSKLENIEIGVNIQLPFCPNYLLRNLLFHRTAGFDKTISGAYYYQSKKNEYIIKIYNKTAQYQRKQTEIKAQLKQNKLQPPERKRLEFLQSTIDRQLKPYTMRFEIKFLKMNVLNDLGLVTISDLLKPEIFSQFKKMLLNEFQEIYFYDYTTDENKMTSSEQIKIKDYRNPNYWQNLNRDKKKYEYP